MKSFKIGFGGQLCNYMFIDNMSWILPHVSLALNILHGFERPKAHNIHELGYMRCVGW